MSVRPVSISFTGDAKAFYSELNKVRGEMGSLRTEASKINQAFGKIGGQLKSYVAGYLSFRAVVGTVRAITTATAEAQAAQAQLNNALAAAGADVATASAAFQAHATQLQRMTTFGDDAIMQVQSLLLSFRGLSGDTVKQATASVLDLATRMGTDAPEAAKLLGKALADPEKGMAQLARSGVMFTEAERERVKAMVDAGKLTEAQTIILGKLEKQFGGAAAAARNTFGGALAGLKNAFGDLLEGGSGFDRASQSINELTEVLSSPEMKQAMDSLISGLALAIRLSAEATIALGKLFNWKHLRPEAQPLEQQIRILENQIADWESANPNGMRGERQKENLANAQAELIALRARLEIEKELARQAATYGGPLRQMGVAPSSDANARGLNFTTGGVDDEEETENQRKVREERTKAEQAELMARFQAEADYHAARNELVEDALAYGDDLAKRSFDFSMGLIDAETEFFRDQARERLQIEQEAQERIQELREGAVNAGIGLLQLLAQKSKGAAKALILINKGLAINQAIQNTAAAVMATTASNGGLPWAAPMVAKVKALGATQIGLIAATGALELSGFGAGGGGVSGGSPGTPNNPIFSRQDDEAQPGAERQRALQVVFAGPVYGMTDFKDQLVEMLREEVDGRDVVIFSGSSRQAQELKAA